MPGILLEAERCTSCKKILKKRVQYLTIKDVKVNLCLKCSKTISSVLTLKPLVTNLNDFMTPLVRQSIVYFFCAINRRLLHLVKPPKFIRIIIALYWIENFCQRAIVRIECDFCGRYKGTYIFGKIKWAICNFCIEWS